MPASNALKNSKSRLVGRRPTNSALLLLAVGSVTSAPRVYEDKIAAVVAAAADWRRSLDPDREGWGQTGRWVVVAREWRGEQQVGEAHYDLDEVVDWGMRSRFG